MIKIWKFFLSTQVVACLRQQTHQNGLRPGQSVRVLPHVYTRVLMYPVVGMYRQAYVTPCVSHAPKYGHILRCIAWGLGQTMRKRLF